MTFLIEEVSLAISSPRLLVKHIASVAILPQIKAYPNKLTTYEQRCQFIGP